MWLGAFADSPAQTVTFVGGHRYRFDFTSTTPFGDPSTAAQVVASWTDVVWPQGSSLTPGLQGNGPLEKDGYFDYRGPTGQVTLPALPSGVTLAVTDQGPTPPAPSAGPSAGAVILTAFAAAAIIGLVAYVTMER